MNCLIKLYACVFLLFGIKNDSVVLGNAYDDCLKNVYKMFQEDNSPKEHFLHAFKNYNQEYFNNFERDNKYAKGYFEDLINSVNDLVDNILEKPMEFYERFQKTDTDKKLCEEVIYFLFGKKDKVPEEDFYRIFIIQELDAFKQFYRTQIYSDLMNDDGVPHKHTWPLNKSEELDEDKRKQRKKSMMRIYLSQFFRTAGLVANFTKFNKVEEYCKIVTKRKAYLNCLENVYKMFQKDNSPKENFLHAFKNYNQEYFNNLEGDNNYAQGYFENLINSVFGLVDDILEKPLEFYERFQKTDTDKTLCKEVLYFLFGEKDTEEDIHRIFKIRELDAFKQFYRTQIYNDLMHDVGVPHKHLKTLTENEESDEGKREQRKKC